MIAEAYQRFNKKWTSKRLRKFKRIDELLIGVPNRNEQQRSELWDLLKERREYFKDFNRYTQELLEEIDKELERLQNRPY